MTSIMDTESKKRAYPFLLCAGVGPVVAYTSIDDGTTRHTAASFDDFDSVFFRTVKQKRPAVVITREPSTLIHICKHSVRICNVMRRGSAIISRRGSTKTRWYQARVEISRRRPRSPIDPATSIEWSSTFRFQFDPSGSMNPRQCYFILLAADGRCSIINAFDFFFCTFP
ncbi:hypothetical protein DEU56DRAFT_900288 [Suillus clintonianus]|uniref:uncharacterized protein n=1 Tax=Suillus clintonianus TaxID=1904413 RepID=UPI001B880073|nr:uncharacterized protein DEU56DRAFT_900288 [Suillus clintonianus]KAG2142945.1 hypothetical protein DEU56DRAFT_900288 [Suillus clintonianus]